jgi:vacuolar iron transporter family protein
VDGLVTNAALIAGVGGGGVATSAIVLTGLVGLAAGAFSMGTGEYVSVTNQNELVAAEVAVERDMHARFPDAEREELVDLLQLWRRPRYGSPYGRRCCRTFLAYAP